MPQVRFDRSVWSAARQGPGAAAMAAPSFAQGYMPLQALSPRQDPCLQALRGTTMGTTWTLRLVNADYAPLAPVRELVQGTLDEVIAQMSNWERGSDLSHYNRAAPGSWHPLPEQLGQVIDAALHWARACDGAWDPSIGALVSLWGFGPRAHPEEPHAGEPPAQADIDAALACCGHQRLQWQAGTRRLWQPGGLQLDLSGIAKGFAVDWVCERLRQAGWCHGLLEIGGELRGWGCRPDGSPWRVAIAGQAEERSEERLAVPLSEGALASSGDHWHVFSHQGRRYSHTLDPRTGWPVDHVLTSVTVWHRECMHADALATVLTVLGPDAGWEFARERRIAAVFQDHAGPRRCTPAWLEWQASES